MTLPFQWTFPNFSFSDARHVSKEQNFVLKGDIRILVFFVSLFEVFRWDKWYTLKGVCYFYGRCSVAHRECSGWFSMAHETSYRKISQGLNTLRPRQNGRYFPDDIFECIFLKENVWIPIKISLKSVPKSPINNIPAFGSENGLATSHYLKQWWLDYRRIYTSPGPYELSCEIDV